MKIEECFNGFMESVCPNVDKGSEQWEYSQAIFYAGAHTIITAIEFMGKNYSATETHLELASLRKQLNQFSEEKRMEYEAKKAAGN